MKLEHKFINFEIKAKGDKNSFEIIASDESLDRNDGVMKMDGCNLEDFKKNPIMPYNHNLWDVPIGSHKDIRIEDHKLKMTAVFANHQFAKDIAGLYADGHLNGFSIGAEVVKRNEQNPSIIEEWKLWEVSAVNIPANPNAVVQKGLEVPQKMNEIILKYGIDEIMKRIQYYESNHKILKKYREFMVKMRENAKIEKNDNEIQQITEVFLNYMLK